MFGTGFLIGLVGGMHCILMCAPVMYTLHPSRKAGGQILYQSGRILTYAILGLLIGALGDGLSLFGWQQGLSIAMGVLMILMTLIPGLRKKFYSLSIQNPLIKRFRRFLAGSGQARPALAGMLNGLLPCGLVYVGLTGSLALGDTMNGMIFMLGFGLGTVPWLTGAVVSSRFLPDSFRIKASRAIPVLAIAVGVLFILRGLALDIPYISPALQSVGLPAEMTMCGS